MSNEVKNDLLKVYNLPSWYRYFLEIDSVLTKMIETKDLEACKTVTYINNMFSLYKVYYFNPKLYLRNTLNPQTKLSESARLED